MQGYVVSLELPLRGFLCQIPVGGRCFTTQIYSNVVLP